MEVDEILYVQKKMNKVQEGGSSFPVNALWPNMKTVQPAGHQAASSRYGLWAAGTRLDPPYK